MKNCFSAGLNYDTAFVLRDPDVIVKKINEKNYSKQNKDGIIDYHQSYNHTHIGIAFFCADGELKEIWKQYMTK